MQRLKKNLGPTASAVKNKVRAGKERLGQLVPSRSGTLEESDDEKRVARLDTK